MSTIYTSNDVPLTHLNHYHGADSFSFFTSVQPVGTCDDRPAKASRNTYFQPGPPPCSFNISTLSRSCEICALGVIHSRILASIYCLILKQISSFLLPILAFFPRLLLYNHLQCLPKISCSTAGSFANKLASHLFSKQVCQMMSWVSHPVVEYGRHDVNVLPSFEAQLPKSHCSSMSSSPLLPGNSDRYVVGPNQYNCVSGQGSTWWGWGSYRHSTESFGGGG